MKRFIVGCDHVAVALKEAVLAHLSQRKLAAADAGTFSPDVIVDYTDYSQTVARAVASGEYDGGVVMCGTGLGASIAANKVPGARAALCHDVFTAHQARAHNDANILAMGAWVVSLEQMPTILDEWLDTPFEGGRHTARLKVIDRYLPNWVELPKLEFDPNSFRYSMALSMRKTSFGPVLFAGRVEEGFSALAAAGFRHVELSLRNADDLSPTELSKLLDDHGLQVTAFATGQGCIHDGLCFTAPEPQMVLKAAKRINAFIDLAAEFQADVILGGVRGRLSGTPEEQAAQRSRAVEAMAGCCAHADTRHVTLLIEPINRYETNFINDASEALAFLDEIDSSTTKILLDTFHMNIEEVDIPTTIRMVGDKLGYLHIVDSNRQAPGQGHINLVEVLAQLHKSGYRGVVSAEILPLPDDESAVLRTRNYLAALGVTMQPAVK